MYFLRRSEFKIVAYGVHLSPFCISMSTSCNFGNLSVQGVSIGPFCTVGPSVKIGNGCKLYPGSHISGDTELGVSCTLMTCVSNGIMLFFGSDDHLCFQRMRSNRTKTVLFFFKDFLCYCFFLEPDKAIWRIGLDSMHRENVGEWFPDGLYL
ncbi:hypothetical protein SAY86_024672 [Trapa natans]|uniref:Uncharacterized protein n=1 Tax=Trapa natans TaxID=22666 RepID=A0AAN7RDL0_TRANT|nr:hypothetical protein SAY86_024672 [Trapa natans]